MAVKKGDFVTIEYVGRLDERIFDLTDEALAKKENIYRKDTKYGPVTIIVGKSQLIKGIDNALEGKNKGDEFDLEVQPEDGFGKKNPKLLKIVPTNTFKQQKINPMPGMQLNIDGIMGTIISVSSGRVILDFNHPLAGKTLNYHVKIGDVLSDKNAKINAIFELYLNLEPKDLAIKEDGKSVTIEYKTKIQVHDKLKEVMIEDIKKYIGFEKVELKEDIDDKAENKGSENGE